MNSRDFSNYGPRNQSDFRGRLIATKTLKLETKRYYIDIKETDKFMFLKLTEIETGGKKSKITLDLQSAADFHFMLTEFNEFFTNLGPQTSNAGRRDELAPLKSDSFTSKDRKIFLDLKENKWGRFLKVSMTVSPSREKHKLIIPAQGMTDLIDAFTELLSEANSKSKKNEGRKASRDDVTMNVDGKNYNGVKEKLPPHLLNGKQSFEVNVNKNAKGTFLRITEVNDNIEKSVSIPQEFWLEFLEKLKESTNTDGNQPTSQPLEECMIEE